MKWEDLNTQLNKAPIECGEIDDACACHHHHHKHNHNNGSECKDRNDLIQDREIEFLNKRCDDINGRIMNLERKVNSLQDKDENTFQKPEKVCKPIKKEDIIKLSQIIF